ncbi:MAG: DUF3025 domain-containing protein [Rhodocyclales bacterium]|nr:DUF3025 domain-containing protein [Rhodocyclales bacterium]
MAPITDLGALAARPLFEPVAEWLRIFGGEAPPDVAALNAALASREMPAQAASGAPIRFVLPADSAAGYEERVFTHGEVETRADNWHDFFNALAWLAYPRTKRVLNGRHHAALQAQRAAGSSARGTVRDAITQFDECGIVVASASPELAGLIRAHEWKELFWQRRAQLARDMRFFVFGHATWDQLRAPFVGLTAKAVFLEVEAAWLSRSIEHQLADVDGRLAGIFSRPDAYAMPRDFQPLPLLGIPGVATGNAEPAYYDDTRQFRPRRNLAALPSGAPPFG